MVGDLMGTLYKYQEHVKEGKHCRDKMEEIKGMVKDIFVFEDNSTKALTKISKMSSHENK